LGFSIKGKPLDKKQGGNASVDMNFDGNKMSKALSMSYYANQLGVHLSVESITSHALDLLFSKQDQGYKSVLSLADITKLSAFI
jgi:hypothetical protein